VSDLEGWTVCAKIGTVEFQGGPLEGTVQVDLTADYRSLSDERSRYAADALSYGADGGPGVELLVLWEGGPKPSKKPLVYRIEQYAGGDAPRATARFIDE